CHSADPGAGLPAGATQLMSTPTTGSATAAGASAPATSAMNKTTCEPRLMWIPLRPGKQRARRVRTCDAGIVTIRVVVAEDNLLVREGLERLLGLQADVEVVA